MTHELREVFTSEAAEDAAEREFDLLLHPGKRYDRPADVLADRSLTMTQRRAILSAWASDACALPSSPVLRQPAFATGPVTFDEIMDSLRDLDGVASPQPVTRPLHQPGLSIARISVVTDLGLLK